MILTPDTGQKKLWDESIAPHMKAGKTVMFGHGFNIRFGQIVPPLDVDVSMVAPKSPGHRVRELYKEGEGTPALLAVEQNASGHAREDALAYAKALGTTRAGVLETTFAEETETDLFGEQAVLCGGTSALVKAGFQTLVDAGYQPEVAYFECLHELKLIVDLMYRGGLNYMRYSISDTAEHGDYTAGPRIVTDATRREMKKILEEIQEGVYAEKWIAENAEGRPPEVRGDSARRSGAARSRRSGAELRERMPFLHPVVIEGWPEMDRGRRPSPHRHLRHDAARRRAGPGLLDARRARSSASRGSSTSSASTSSRPGFPIASEDDFEAVAAVAAKVEAARRRRARALPPGDIDAGRAPALDGGRAPAHPHLHRDLGPPPRSTSCA